MLSRSTIKRLLILKAYFDRGVGVTSFFKYLLGGFGGISVIANINPKWFILLFVSYIIGCFIIGKLWMEKGLVNIENEIANHYNPFVHEVRRKLRRRKV